MEDSRPRCGGPTEAPWRSWDRKRGRTTDTRGRTGLAPATDGRDEESPVSSACGWFLGGEERQTSGEGAIETGAEGAGGAERWHTAGSREPSATGRDGTGREFES